MALTRRKFIKGGILAVGGLMLVDAFWVEQFFIEQNEYYIGEAKESDTTIKIVQLSDLHLQSINYQLKRLAGVLNTLMPDIIVITGDSIDDKANILLLDDFLKLFDSKIRKAAILGNREYVGEVDLEKMKSIYEKYNCQLLVNQSVQYNCRGKLISITGVDDYIGGVADYGLAIKEYKQGDYHIVLNHCPMYSDTIAKLVTPEVKVDFVLSGHTHGGQLNFLGLIPYLPKGSGRYVKGWYKDVIPNVYVSKGIGTTVLPARIGARAEIAIFNLKA